jgi:hypothetical protein
MITDDTLTVDLEDGRTISVPIGWFPWLAHGAPEERANFQISGAGRGIHWPGRRHWHKTISYALYRFNTIRYCG